MTSTICKSTLVTAAIAAVACSSVVDLPYMQEGQPHAEAIVSAVTQHWNADELLKEADPRMLEAFPATKVRQMMAECSTSLGSITRQHTIVGTTGRETGVSGQTTSYRIGLEGTKGSGTVTIKLQKLDGTWKVLGFWAQIDEASPSPRQ